MQKWCWAVSRMTREVQCIPVVITKCDSGRLKVFHVFHEDGHRRRKACVQLYDCDTLNPTSVHLKSSRSAQKHAYLNCTSYTTAGDKHNFEQNGPVEVYPRKNWMTDSSRSEKLCSHSLDYVSERWFTGEWRCILFRLIRPRKRSRRPCDEHLPSPRHTTTARRENEFGMTNGLTRVWTLIHHELELQTNDKMQAGKCVYFAARE